MIDNAKVLVEMTPDNLTSEIRRMIDKGYEPQGGVSLAQSEIGNGDFKLTVSVLMVRHSDGVEYS